MPSQRFKGFKVFKGLEGLEGFKGLRAGKRAGLDAHKKPLMCGLGVACWLQDEACQVSVLRVLRFLRVWRVWRVLRV